MAQLSRIKRPRWRTFAIGLIVATASVGFYNLACWYFFTRHLYGENMGNMKRLGYLVFHEDRKAAMMADDPITPALTDLGSYQPEKEYPILLWGDSHGGFVARAFGLRLEVDALMIGQKPHIDCNLLMTDLAESGALKSLGVKVVILERTEREWLNTFSPRKSRAARRKAFSAEQFFNLIKAPLPNRTAQGADHATEPSPQIRQRLDLERRSGVFNSGNYRIALFQIGYLISPTVFGESSIYRLKLNKPFFNCSYGDELLFYDGQIREIFRPEESQALRELQGTVDRLAELNTLLRRHQILLVLCPVPGKAHLYHPWVIDPPYEESLLLDQFIPAARARGIVCIDFKSQLRQRLRSGEKDLYYPDDTHLDLETTISVVDHFLDKHPQVAQSLTGRSQPQ